MYIQGEQISRERSTLFCDLPQNVLVTTCRTNNRFTVCLHFLFYWIRNNKFLYHQRAPIAPSVWNKVHHAWHVLLKWNNCDTCWVAAFKKYICLVERGCDEEVRFILSVSQDMVTQSCFMLPDIIWHWVTFKFCRVDFSAAPADGRLRNVEKKKSFLVGKV